MDTTTPVTPQDRFKKSPLKSAVILKTGADGLTTTAVLYRKDVKRRTSKRWKGVDKLIRKLSRAQQTTANEFAARYERSSQKKKNGGVRDLLKNALKAQRKGRKKLKIRFL